MPPKFGPKFGAETPNKPKQEKFPEVLEFVRTPAEDVRVGDYLAVDDKPVLVEKISRLPTGELQFFLAGGHPARQAEEGDELEVVKK